MADDFIVYDDDTGEVIFRGTLIQCRDCVKAWGTRRELKINRPGFALQETNHQTFHHNGVAYNELGEEVGNG